VRGATKGTHINHILGHGQPFFGVQEINMRHRLSFSPPLRSKYLMARLKAFSDGDE
jgi:hypothetical protein